MTIVYGEDVRDYHWEYYREMSDMWNDVQNSILAKNPFGFALDATRNGFQEETAIIK